MRQFDESKVINGLHQNLAIIGKRYWFADDIVHLKEEVESNRYCDYELNRIDNRYFYFSIVYICNNCGHIVEFNFPMK